MSRFLLAPEARADLEEIAGYIARDSPSAAHRVLEEIRSQLHRLSAFPGMGHLRRDLAPEPLRFWQVYSYLIVYRPDRRPIEVVRVLHSARDVAAILGSDA